MRLVLHAAALSGGSPIVTPVVFLVVAVVAFWLGRPLFLYWIRRELSFRGVVLDWVPSPPTPEALVVRVAHLSDLHIVGERYGYRMEAGTNGPRCNRVIRGALRTLATIHASTPFDRVLMTGDITDAGTLHSGRSLLTSCAAAQSYAGGCRWCRVTTTSTSLIAPTRDAWTCRGALASCAGSAACSRLIRWRAIARISSTGHQVGLGRCSGTICARVSVPICCASWPIVARYADGAK